ncbi:MAG: inorganic phosphate transporter [Oscillatoriaceae cyanobacterium Prado104]|jgi:PiT family inorganic phosphate transporter|nr:inorganic phosphate transporter [Oscillatoriaceae cyanobacterium Prado104]
MLTASGVAFGQLVAMAVLALYVASQLGANDVANSMGTSVGSKALTLRQALVVAGILEFAGAVFFGRGVSETLATGVVNPAAFAAQPEVFLIGMVSVLVSCGLWLQIATHWGLPVSSSHAVVGAIAGFSSIAAGIGAVNWGTIGIISLTWVATPIASGAVAGVFYSLVKRYILDRPDPLFQMREWIPWLSAALLGVFGIIVLPSVVDVVFVQTGAIGLVRDRLGWNIPVRDIVIGIGAIGAVAISLNSWNVLEKESATDFVADVADGWKVKSGDLATGNVLDVTDRRAIEIGKSTNSPPLPLSPSLPLPPSPPPPLSPSPIERQMARFQVLSACFVAFAHGSNDVGNAVAPLAAIAYIRRTGAFPSEDFSVPLWILVVGGAGIVIGLAIWGKKVIATVGENIIQLQPSGGFCAELATATTVLLASRLGLPVSTSHALVGAVVGVGIARNWKSVQFQTLLSIGSAWLVTIPIAAGLSAVIFSIARWIL